MKKTISTLALSFILIFLTMESNAQQNFIVSLKMPPPGSLNTADFWNISVTNNSDSGKSVYLIGTAIESKDGQIAKGTTVPFMLKKGLNNIKIKDLPKTPDVEYTASDPRYKESLIRAGKFPSGNYEICVKVISAVGNEELGSDCINQEVSETGLISLISPADGEEIDAKAPVTFTWSSGGKMPEGGYTLKIVEVMEQQSNETALKNNKAFFEKKGINTTFLQYPNAAARFEEGKKYAWGIANSNNFEKNAILSLNSFSVSKFEISKEDSIVTLPDEDIVEVKEEFLIDLISPMMNAKEGESRPEFIWKSKISEPGLTYSIKIVVMTEIQDLKIVMETNSPLFEERNITETKFLYPTSMKPIDSNKFYLWTITAWNVKGDQVGYSMVGGFRLPMPPPPACTFALSAPSIINVCQGSQATLTFNATNISSNYYYILLDPFLNAVTPLLTGNGVALQTVSLPVSLTSGNYTLVGIQFFTLPWPCSWLGCMGICTYTSTIVINVSPSPPVPIIEPTDHDLPCNGSIFLVTNSPASVYKWQRCSSCANNCGACTSCGSCTSYLDISNSNSPSYEVTQPGCYRVKVTTNGCSNVSVPWYINDPTPAPVITGTSHYICNQPPLIGIQLSTNCIGTLTWYKNPSSVPIGSGSTVNITTAGNYYVTSSVTTSTGTCVTSSAFWNVQGNQCECVKCTFTLYLPSFGSIVQSGTYLGIPKYKVRFKINNSSGFQCPANFTITLIGPPGNTLLTSPALPNYAPSGMSPVSTSSYHTCSFASSNVSGTSVYLEFMFTLLNGITGQINNCKIKQEFKIP